MQFAYQARDLTGRIRDGLITAETAAEATRQLRTEGLYLLSLDEHSGRAPVSSLPVFQKRITRNEIVYLTNQLAVMIDAGVPLATALGGLAQQCANSRLKRILDAIQKDVESGEDFSTTLARFPKHFDRTYINLVKASEASGTLAPMLERIAAHLRAELETRQKVRGALLYPAVMLVLCIGVSIFLLAYVFPKLLPMFATRSVEVPLPTRLMMSASDALVHQWPWLLLGTAVLGGFLAYARGQPWGRRILDSIWLNLPIFGPMQKKVIIGRSLRTLATTINAGVPVLQAIQLSAGVARNVHYERAWQEAGDLVEAGKQIHEALEGNRLFPATLLQMIASGEASGKLGLVLNKVSDYFDREVSNAIKTVTSLVEPVMVLVMGGVIGTIALAMLLPIFQLSSHIG